MQFSKTFPATFERLKTRGCLQKLLERILETMNGELEILVTEHIAQEQEIFPFSELA